MPNGNELMEIVERAFGGLSSVSGPDGLFRGDIVYQPAFLLKEPAKPGGQRVFGRAAPQELWTPEKLNPAHLQEQGIESILDPSTGNVVYSLSAGQVRIGFYDRRKLLGMDQSQWTKDYSEESLRQLVQGIDPQCPRIPVIDFQPLVDVLLGKSFPGMFNYRSVVFPEDMVYGLFIDADKSIAGEAVTVKDVEIKPDFVEKYPQTMNYLIPLILEAAKKHSLEFADLELSDSVAIQHQFGYLMYKMIKSKYSLKVSYTTEPGIAAFGRLNGIPLLLSAQRANGEMLCVEMFKPALDMGSSYLITFPHGILHNAEDKDKSLIGDITYRIIPRDESVQAKQDNINFGLLEVGLVLGVKVSGFEARFEKEETPQIMPHLEEHGNREVKGYGAQTLGMGREYTAGHSTVKFSRRATIETSAFHFSRMLLHDVLCLVNREMSERPMPYSG